jgi:hypothetical protein
MITTYKWSQYNQTSTRSKGILKTVDKFQKQKLDLTLGLTPIQNLFRLQPKLKPNLLVRTQIPTSIETPTTNFTPF